MCCPGRAGFWCRPTSRRKNWPRNCVCLCKTASGITHCGRLPSAARNGQVCDARRGKWMQDCMGSTEMDMHALRHTKFPALGPVQRTACPVLPPYFLMRIRFELYMLWARLGARRTRLAFPGTWGPFIQSLTPEEYARLRQRLRLVGLPILSGGRRNATSLSKTGRLLAVGLTNRLWLRRGSNG